MKAAWYNKTGSAKDVLTYGDIATPRPGPNDVLIEVKASGINPSDVKTRAGARGPIAFPEVIPHSDGAGIIVDVGEKVSKSRVGERVWLWNSAWKRAHGTAAQYVALPSEQAVSLPETTSFAAGACLGIPASTACHGVLGFGPVDGKTVLVTGGAGAVGHYAVQIAKLSGARVITTVSSAEKAQVARQAGADLVINYRDGKTAEEIMEATQGDGVDHIVEVEFGGNLEVTRQVIRANGRVATYGSMMQPQPTIPFYDLMFKNIRIDMFLIYLLDTQARQTVITHLSLLLESGNMSHNISHEYPLAEIALAHEAVEAARHSGNIVLNLD